MKTIKNIMKRFRLMHLAAIACLASCASQLYVTTDYDKTADFSRYKTFAMDTMHVSQSISALNVQRILDAVKAEMISKGFSESPQPDVLVHIAAIIADKKYVTATSNYYGYGGMYRPYAWGYPGTAYTTYNVSEYKEGSLIIDIADAKAKKLVWEGIGNKEIDGTGGDPDQAIPAAVKKIMAGFPPQKKSK